VYDAPKSKLKSLFAEENPRNVPTHPLLVRLKLRQRSSRNQQQGQVAGMKVRQEAVEAIDHRRAGRAPRLVIRSEHEVVDEQLRAAVKQFRRRSGAIVRVEAVLLLDPDPGQLAPLPRQVVA
jgi:hypothetical protein